jgi:hypothetical protein
MIGAKFFNPATSFVYNLLFPHVLNGWREEGDVGVPISLRFFDWES